MKKRSSNQIRNLIVIFVALMMIVLVGLIIFLLTVDVKDVRNYGDEQKSSNNTIAESSQKEEINVSDYELAETSADGDIEIRLSDGKLLFSVKRDDLFKENYPKAVIDTSTDEVIAIHENKIADICIGRIDKKNYLFVLTDKGSVGVMNIDEAVNTDVFRIKNKMISFDKPVIRMIAFDGIEAMQTNNTVVVWTEDGDKFDLTKFVE